MAFELKKKDEFSYIDEGKGEVLMLLHGLFGALSNWHAVIDHFSKKYRVVIPMLPIYEMPIRQADLEGLVSFTERFVATMGFGKVTLLGNSLGGHIALLYVLKNDEHVKNILLTGSSGLFEDSMGGSFPKRGNYQYIKDRVEYTFYDPNTATKELIDEVFDITNNNMKCLRIISIAKSAQRNNLAKELSKIKQPVLLVWGMNDTITPPNVGHEFQQLLPNAELKLIDKCGHAPMMEHPIIFNQYLDDFLDRNP